MPSVQGVQELKTVVQMRAKMSMFGTVNSTLILFYGFRYRFA